HRRPLGLVACRLLGLRKSNASQALSPEMTARVVSLSGGALFANVVSVIILIAETIMQRR
uniref:DUF6394 family protein n=1 Tax=Thauera phenylacetica TaxID=164400 RepID=UPI0039E3D7FF